MALSRALEIEKLKAALFRGPEGARDTNDHTCDIILDANREIWALKSYFVF